MSISKLQSPAEHSPIHNPLVYTWRSDNTAEVNFSFKVEVRYNDVVIYTDFIYPTNGNKAYIDLQPIVENYIQSPKLKGQEINIDLDELKLFVVEYWGEPPTLKSTTLTGFDIVYLFNISLSDIEYSDFDLLTTFRSNRLFTDNPDINKGVKALRGQPLVLSQFIDWVFGVKIQIAYKDDAGATLFTFNKAIDECDIVQIDVNDFYDEVGVPSIEDVYEIQVTISSGETAVFEYVTPCYNPSSLIWQNKYGSFDTFVFNHNLIDSNEIESYSYMKKYGEWDGENYTFDLSQHREVNYKKKSSHKGEIVSDYMSEEKRNWLARSLYLSNKVWIYKDGRVQAIKVNDLRYTKKNNRFDELKDLIVKFDYSYQENSILS